MKNTGTRRKKGLAVMLIAGVAAVIIILSAATAVIGYREFTSVVEQQYNDSAYEVAETARSYLNPDRFGDYLTTLEKDAEYEEIEKRRAEMPIKKKENITGYLKRYAAMVSSADQGAIINR